MHSERDACRDIPSVDRVLRTPEAIAALEEFGRALVIDSVRAVLEVIRRGLAQGGSSVPSDAEIAAAARARMTAARQLPLRRVINATGVVLHTNLGRALLADEAIAAVQLASSAATNLELELAQGRRGERENLVRADLCALTEADAATVVNNNAAALLVALNSLADGREVIVSRGELIEIGGSFRIPELMAKSGAVLREVGTTNRTHLRDYREAIGEHTGMILKVHTSNYRVVGFTHSVGLGELVALGRETQVPVVEDLGSGALIDLSVYGLPKEPVVREQIAAGADLVCFSGDKLLGGPQAGILVGRSELVAAIDRNPLKRALRCDKLTLAALAATLRLYRTSPDLGRSLPTLRLLTRPLDELRRLGEAALEPIRASLGPDYRVELVDSQAEIGSGAQPTETLPSLAIVLDHPEIGAHEIAERFRRADPPVIGRVHDGRFWLDLRAVETFTDLIPGAGAAAS